MPRDDAEGLKWYRVADKGDAETQTRLGTMYREGQHVARDYKEAINWLRRAADQGNATAQNNLGGMYSRGEGVPQSYTEAVKWYRLAAEQGLAVAQYNLGFMYARGRGVAPDYVRVHMWLSLAAAQGHQEAIEGIDQVAKRMTATQVAEAQKLAREWKPTK